MPRTSIGFRFRSGPALACHVLRAEVPGSQPFKAAASLAAASAHARVLLVVRYKIEGKYDIPVGFKERA